MKRDYEVFRSTDLAAALGMAVIVGTGMGLTGFSPAIAAASSYLGAAMLLIALADRRLFLVPDVVVLPAIPLGLLAAGSLVSPVAETTVPIENLLGALVGGSGLYLVRVGYRSLRKREGLGLGDVKLAAAAGAWVGMQRLPVLLLLACLLALSVVAAQAVIGRSQDDAAVGMGTALPFGLFLAPATWLVWMVAVTMDHQFLDTPA